MNYYNKHKRELHKKKQQMAVDSAPNTTRAAQSGPPRRHPQSSKRYVTNVAKRIIRAQKPNKPKPPPKHSFLAAVQRRLNAPAPPIPAKRFKAAARTRLLLPLLRLQASVKQRKTSSASAKKARVSLPPMTHP